MSECLSAGGGMGGGAVLEGGWDVDVEWHFTRCSESEDRGGFAVDERF